MQVDPGIPRLIASFRSPGSRYKRRGPGSSLTRARPKKKKKKSFGACSGKADDSNYIYFLSVCPSGWPSVSVKPSHSHPCNMDCIVCLRCTCSLLFSIYPAGIKPLSQPTGLRSWIMENITLSGNYDHPFTMFITIHLHVR